MSSIRNRLKPLSTSMTAKHRAGRELLGLRDRGRAVSSTSSHLVGVARHAGEAGRVGVRAPSFQVLHLPGDPAPDRVETLGPAARRPSTLSGGARLPSPLPLCRLGSTSRPSARTCGVPTRDFVPISTRISPSAASGSCSVALAGVARAERMGGARAGRYANLVLEAPRRGTQGFVRRSRERRRGVCDVHPPTPTNLGPWRRRVTDAGSLRVSQRAQRFHSV